MIKESDENLIINAIKNNDIGKMIDINEILLFKDLLEIKNRFKLVE